MLVHGEGDFLGKPFKLEGFQREFIYRLYEYDPNTLRRAVRRALLILPKGCGKTELVAAICLAELAGPTSLDENGKPALRSSPNIPIAAASFKQAERLFLAARVMATEGALAPYVDAYDTKILLKDRLGQMFRVAAEAGTNDGGLPTCFGADEIHEWQGRKARVHLVIGNSLAKRAEGVEINISTPDEADPETLLGGLVRYGEKVASGEIEDPSFLYVRYAASDKWNLDDPKELRAAIREATPASWVDIERIAARYEIDRIPEHEFRRYHLAQFVRPNLEHWLPGGAWEECTSPKHLEPGDEIVLGFDGSYNNDSTALVACRVEDSFIKVIDAWERPDNDPNWIVPRDEVDARVKETFETYRVTEMACDPPGWHHEIEKWAEMYGEPPVIHFPTGARKRMAEACSKFYTAVVNKDITHDGDSRLARHLENAVVKETAEGAYITKERRSSPKKIDIAIAAVVAHDRANQRVEDDDSVYLSRGLLTL